MGTFLTQVEFLNDSSYLKFETGEKETVFKYTK